jgi:hypothetical protein
MPWKATLTLHPPQYCYGGRAARSHPMGEGEVVPVSSNSVRLKDRWSAS